MTLRVAAMTFAGLVASQNAFAADINVEMLTEAPEVEISEPTGGAYIAARLGAAFADDTAFGLTVVPTTIANEYEDTSLTGGIALGYRFNDMISAEFEGGYSEQDIESHTLTALPATLSDPNAFGTTKITYGLVNLAVHQPTGTMFTPYISAGLGLADVAFETHGVNLAAPVGPLGRGAVTALNDSDTALAWQLGGGVLIDITDKIGLEVGYRYFSVNDVDLTAVDGTVSETDVTQHQALFGVRYSF